MRAILFSGLCLLSSVAAAGSDETVQLGHYTLAVRYSSDSCIDFNYTPYNRTHPEELEAEYPDLANGKFVAHICASSVNGWAPLHHAGAVPMRWFQRRHLYPWILENERAFRAVFSEGRDRISVWTDSSREIVDRYTYESSVVQTLRWKGKAIPLFDPESTETEDSWLRKAEAGQAPRPFQLLKRVTTPINRHALVVVHLQNWFSNSRDAVDAVNSLVARFKNAALPVIYLVSSDADGTDWLTEDRKPDFALYSEGGQHALNYVADEVTVVGGYFGGTETGHGCHRAAIVDLIQHHFRANRNPLQINVPIDATYFYDDDEGFRKALLENRHVPTLPGFITDGFVSGQNLKLQVDGVQDPVSLLKHHIRFNLNGSKIVSHGIGSRRTTVNLISDSRSLKPLSKVR